MKSNPRFKAKHVLSLCLAVAGGLAMSAHAQTAEELIAKNTEAKGGIEKIKAITSLRLTGKLEEGGVVILLQDDQKAESLLRQSITIQGMTQVQAYDGADGWQIDPFGGRRDPERMGEDDSRDMAENADFYGPLIDYQKKGNKVESVGHASVDGDDALLLKVTLKNGDVINYFLDPDTYLEIRTEKQVFVRGSVRESFNNLGSYKKVNGVYFPFSVESGSPRNPGNTAKITYSAIEANVELSDSEFKMPAAKLPAAPTGDKTEKPKPAL
jgi:outer membrane lipoprotein-sorting protein